MSKLTIEIGAKISGLVNGFNSGLSAVGKFASGVKSAMGSVAGQIVGALSVAGVVAFARNVVAAGDAIADGAKRLQVTTDEYQKLDFAAKQTGASMADIQAAIRTTTNLMDQAGQGSAEANHALNRLGLSFAQLKDMLPYERFRLIIAALYDVADVNDRAALATEVFGQTTSQALMPMIGQYEDLVKAAEINGLMSEKSVSAAKAYADAVDRLSTALVNAAANSGFVDWLARHAEGLDAVFGRAEKLKSLGATQKGGGLFGAMGEALGDQIFGWKPEGQELTMASGAAPRDVAAAKKKKADDQAAAASREQVREQAAIQQEMEKQIAAAEKAGKEQMRAEASVAASLKDMEDKVRWQRMINDGREREVEIEKALADATEKAKRPLTEQEAAGITSAASQLYDLNAKEGKTVAPLRFESADITDAVRRIGGNLGGRGPASGETKQINLLTDIRGDIKELVSKTPEPTANNARAVWPS